jgi:transposase-like protein
MRSCPRCCSSDLTRDGHDQRGRPVHACGACGRHATSESVSLVAGHRFPRDVILLAVRYYLQLGTAAERIAGVLADRGTACFRRCIESTECTPEHVVTDKATFYPSAIRVHAPGARHTATGFYNRVISTNRCERNHGYVKSHLRPMRGLKSFECAKRSFTALDALQLIERGFVRVSGTGVPKVGGQSYLRACQTGAIVTRLGQGV